MEEVMLEKLRRCGIDVENTLNRFMQREDLYVRFLNKFKQDQNFAGLKESIENEDYEEAFKFAHTLKGVAGNLGLTPLYEEVAVLVEELRKSNHILVNAIYKEEVKEEFRRVEEKYNEIYQIITEQ